MLSQLHNASTDAAQTWVGIHYMEIDVRACVERRIAAIAQDLAEIGSDLDPERVFQIEALGYLVDLETGIVQAGCT